MTANRRKKLGLAHLVSIAGVAAIAWFAPPLILDRAATLLSGNATATQRNFAQVYPVPSGQFKVVADPSWAELQLLSHAALHAARPEFVLEPVAANLDALMDGKAAFAQLSRPLTDAELARAKQRGMRLKQTAIAIDALVVVVHPSLTVPGLTLEQLKRIYSGKIKNWKEVGGSDADITVYKTPNHYALEASHAIGEQLPSTTEVLRRLRQDPKGIYYDSASLVLRQCNVKPIGLGRRLGEYVAPYQEPFVPLSRCPGQRNQLSRDAAETGEYPLLRKLFVVTKENGGADQQAGEAYVNLLLTEQGQSLVDQAGFGRVRS